MADRDRHPTERITLAELHGLGTWPVAVAALDTLGPGYLLYFRRGLIQEARAILDQMELESFPPELHDRLDVFARALRHVGHTESLAVPSSTEPPLTPPEEPR